MTHRLFTSVALLAVCASPALAQQATQPSSFAITPHVGATAESPYVDGPAFFTDGKSDYILIEPNTGVLLGVELSKSFSSMLSGVLLLSYATANARYIEDDNRRPDVGFDTLRVQPGVMVSIVSSDKFALDLGGGLTLFRTSIDGLVWNDRRADSSGLGLGLFGAAGIDIPLSPRLSFHSHLLLELNRPFFGALEEDLARADGEAGAEVDHDARTGLVLAIGLRIGL